MSWGNHPQPRSRRVAHSVVAAGLVARRAAVICERLYALWNLIPKSEAFKDWVVDAIEKGILGKAAALSEMSQVPLADVFERGLQVFEKMPQKTTEAVTSQRSATVLSLKRYLWALGTVGSSAPFVGLFGTVVGILKAFQSMSVAGTGGFKVVSQGLLPPRWWPPPAGLLVAIYRRHRLQLFRRAHQTASRCQYRLYCEEFLATLAESHLEAPRRVPRPRPTPGGTVA